MNDSIRGCSEVLGAFSSFLVRGFRCFFVIFGTSMGGFPFETQCAQFAKLRAFWKIGPKKHPKLQQFGMVMRHKTYFSR